MDVVIIEDEVRAANRLQKLLQELEPDIRVVKRLESVADSIRYFKGNPQLDLIFSDIQLTDSLSFDIYKEVELNAPIIFTTAFNSYAIEAFNTNGIDYLLKPILPADLQSALQKFRKLTKPASELPDMKTLTSLLQSVGRPAPLDYKKRFMVKVGSKLKSIAANQILAFYSKNKASFLYDENKRAYPLDTTLDEIEKQLNPDLFFRINRGFIVNLTGVKDIVAYSNSRLKVGVDGLEQELIIVARDRTKAFKEWLGG